jgi:hypothetical protein
MPSRRVISTATAAAAAALFAGALGATAAEPSELSRFRLLLEPRLVGCETSDFSVDEVYRGTNGSLVTYRAAATCHGQAWEYAESSALVAPHVRGAPGDLRDRVPLLVRNESGYVVASAARGRYLQRLALERPNTVVFAGCVSWVDSQLQSTDMAVTFSKHSFTLGPSARSKRHNHMCWPAIRYGFNELKPDFLQTVFGEALEK